MMYIITHKKVKTPILNGYVPLLVGAYNKELYDYKRDDSGDNISYKNSDYCELTGLYWIWKNTDDSYKGIVHYRRFFCKSRWNGNEKNIISIDKLNEWLEEYDLITTYQEHIRFSLKKKLILYHCSEEVFDAMRDSVLRLYPEYIDCFDKVFNGNTMSICNMVYCKKKVFDSYCEWLFKILNETEKTVEQKKLEYQPRLYGFLSERLFNVWINYNNLNCKRQPIMNIEFNLLKRTKWIFTTYISDLIFKIKKLRNGAIKGYNSKGS